MDLFIKPKLLLFHPNSFDFCAWVLNSCVIAPPEKVSKKDDYSCKRFKTQSIWSRDQNYTDTMNFNPFEWTLEERIQVRTKITDRFVLKYHTISLNGNAYVCTVGTMRPSGGWQKWGRHKYKTIPRSFKSGQCRQSSKIPYFKFKTRQTERWKTHLIHKIPSQNFKAKCYYVSPTLTRLLLNSAATYYRAKQVVNLIWAKTGLSW